ncbi:transglutaminase-like domain-containing protein [Methylocaldum sp. MU1018]
MPGVSVVQSHDGMALCEEHRRTAEVDLRHVLTLQTRRGNAFDTASLLIALLRASDIPARYVYGTIQVPATEVMNWVGGVKTPEAAQSLLGQGGIPNVALVAGGKIAAFKLEHVWVEAFVNYVPSRGAKHHQGDTWVPLDASFKQYTYTEGLDLKSAVPFDAQGLIDRVQAGATINEADGWGQNLDGAALQAALTDYQARIKTYIDSQNPEATVGDVLGTKRIIAQNLPILAGSLPYRTITIARQSAALPDSLRAKYRFTLYTGVDYNPLGGGDVRRGSEVFTYTASLPRLAGGKLTLSFVPATQADTDLISSYLPKPHPDGTPIQPSELPSSLPGYLIHLKAEYRLDGQLVASGGNFVMGSSYLGSSALYSPERGVWDEADDNAQTAGEYWATYVGATVSQARLNAVKAKLEATQGNRAI